MLDFSNITDYDKKGIYLITVLDSGCVYVGSTLRMFSSRWTQHVRQANSVGKKRPIKKNKILSASIRAKGLDNIEFKILEIYDGISSKELLSIEQKWLNWIFSSYPSDKIMNTATIAHNSSGWKHSEESRQKMINNKKKTTGKDHFCYGKKMSDSIKEKVNKAKLVVFKCLENGKIYNGYKEAAEDLKISEQMLSHCVNGRILHVSGYHFERLNKKRNQNGESRILSRKKITDNNKTPIVNDLGEYFESVKDASIKYDCNQHTKKRLGTNITNNLIGRSHSAHGRRWRYATEKEISQHNLNGKV